MFGVYFRVLSIDYYTNIDEPPLVSHTLTHPSHSQTSRLRFTSISESTPWGEVSPDPPFAQMFTIIVTHRESDSRMSLLTVC